MQKDNNAQFSNLGQEQKSQIIKKLLNFPTLPSDIQLSGISQDAALAKYYPWGCQNINCRIRFEVEDRVIYARIDNIANVCLSIKYGICPFQKMDQLMFVSKLLSQAKGKVYVKLAITNIGMSQIYALAQVKQVNTSLTFRFWHNETHKPYPIGVALMQVVAVGQIKDRNQNLWDTYEQLKCSMLDSKHFRAADGLEENQRRKLIKQIQIGEGCRVKEHLQEKMDM